MVIHRNYVDNGSSFNIMYIKIFEELELKKELLRRVRTPLTGFTGWQFFRLPYKQTRYRAQPKEGQGDLKYGASAFHQRGAALHWKMAVLGRFLSKSTEKSLSFFGTLKKVPKFQWRAECQTKFKNLRRDGGEAQRPIYYVNKTLKDNELRYSVVEKMILAVVNMVKKLNNYFQAHEVEVQSHQSLGVIL
ncbi:unnamed protein product [Cuscuta campestris]|uniref:Reverse transcriptase RNase H-like domain-containing protein n=1 Tax=Cuscuta campestris TaxID=132261 RepID=A0A484NE70_9ASTE|nr:unnamed protein product [Cuscuta campestris]